jgi:hypothetical protein
VQSVGRFECADQLELDVVGSETVEKLSSLAEQDWDQLDLQHVQHASRQALLCRVGTVQHDVAVSGGRFRLFDKPPGTAEAARTQRTDAARSSNSHPPACDP